MGGGIVPLGRLDLLYAPLEGVLGGRGGRHGRRLAITVSKRFGRVSAG